MFGDVQPILLVEYISGSLALLAAIRGVVSELICPRAWILFDLEICCRLLAVAIVFKIVLNCCPSLRVVKPARSNALICTNTSVPPPLGHNETITFSWIEPLHSAPSHSLLPDTIKAHK
jgi:hypothetical protein